VDTGRLGGGVSVTAKLARRRGDAFDAADAELRRLIREGFENGIPGEQLAEAAGLSVPRCIKSGTAAGKYRWVSIVYSSLMTEKQRESTIASKTGGASNPVAPQLGSEILRQSLRLVDW
jgi:hypothetical protein